MSDTTTEATSTSSNTFRPVTSKARGVCLYYQTDRGCYNGNKCKFLHGESERLTPYDKNKICHYHVAGFCKYGDRCWFKHVGQSSGEDDYLCSICYDKPATYGLLVNCSHIFCLQCIRNWRGSEGKASDMVESGTTKTCPMCRVPSRFVVPSSLFLPEEDPKKAGTIENFKASMARVKCKYFERSRPQKRFCPFGRDCFYKHENADGTPYMFHHGADSVADRRSRIEANDVVWDLGSEDNGIEAMLNTITQAFSHVHITYSARQQSLLNSVAAAFGVETLPPMFRLEEDHRDEENAVTTDSTSDILTPEQASSLLPSWDSWPAEPYLTTPRQHAFAHSDFSDTPVLPSALRSPTSNIGSTLDPSSPVFVPSHVDRMRSSTSGPETVNSTQFDNFFRELRPSQGHGSAEPDASSQRINVRPSEEALVQDVDPPFMTDGRGRVVWSSTSSSRPHGRGRAVSSAAILPHIKSSISPEECPEEQLQSLQETDDSSSSTSRSLVRRHSVPMLGSDANAEFVTDGRGGVVFASKNRTSHL